MWRQVGRGFCPHRVVGQMDNQRVVAGATFGFEQSFNRGSIGRVDSQAKNSFGGKRDQSALADDLACLAVAANLKCQLKLHRSQSSHGRSRHRCVKG